MRGTHWTSLFCIIDLWFKAPPTGDRKCHVLYFGKLVLAALSDSPQTWSTGTQVFNDEKSKGFAKVKGRGQGVASALRFRQCTGSCCNFRIQCPICSKLHMFDESLTLNTSALQYWFEITAPPTDDCKCHVFTLSPLILRDENAATGQPATGRWPGSNTGRRS